MVESIKPQRTYFLVLDLLQTVDIMFALSSENTNSQFIVYTTLKKKEVPPKENESKGVTSSSLTALSLFFFFLFSFYYYLSCSPLYSLVLHTFISLAI